MNDANPLNLDWIPCGIELTYVHPGELKSDIMHVMIDGEKVSYCDLARDMLELHEDIWEGPLGNIDPDPGCVEWSTPVLHSWEEAKAAWEHGHTIAEMMGMTEEIEHLGGGMGHIHVECDSEQLGQAIMIDLFTRPYVAWAFCHPSAIKYCSPAYMQSNNVPKGLATPDLLNITSPYGKFTDVRCMMQPSASFFGTTKNMRTLEFRFFNSATTWEEQYLNLAFAQSYVQFMKKKIRENSVLPCLTAVNNPADLPSFQRYHPEVSLKSAVRDTFHKNLDFCISEFEAFIKVLGLPFEEYEHLIDQHMRPQFRWGKKGNEKQALTTPDMEMSTLKHMFDLPAPAPIISKEEELASKIRRRDALLALIQRQEARNRWGSSNTYYYIDYDSIITECA